MFKSKIRYVLDPKLIGLGAINSMSDESAVIHTKEGLEKSEVITGTRCFSMEELQHLFLEERNYLW